MKLKSIDISKLISVAGSPGDEGVIKNWVLMVYVHATLYLYFLFSGGLYSEACESAYCMSSAVSLDGLRCY